MEYAVQDGQLFRKDGDKFLWVVPKKVRWKIMREYHNELGQRVLTRTLDD